MRNIIRYVKDWWRARNTGYLRQYFDYRDWRFKPSGEAIASSVDLREYFLNCRNQDYSQACTGFAVASLIEYRMRRVRDRSEGMYYMSPLYNWWYARLMHKTTDQNVGVWLRYNLHVLYKEGLCPESKMPFRPHLYKQPPDYDSEAHGELFKKYLVRTGYYLLTALDVKESLNRGNPVVFGIRLNNSFYGNKDGIIKDSETNSYSHAMLCVGYDDDSECYIARNSWGTTWGDSGYCYIPYDYFERQSHDRWTIDEIEVEQK